ncbi:glycoside hydrolase family 43 protein [Bifidobacterium simiarum]|uniref:Glycoside hydrolase 43 family protein n=1 Tax=Bifidobacterium simiarum TaxID=2045441 RepID=A0A2M9HG70_9BIFI|nr:glycoside hydrolase family 43 protein [Bifidobacterium simiarum]MBT1166340.1 glycoside hydrolase family 43 protein [Bifidobacterium simiarum]PJM75807.1 glycoside hydrolase 43 family protein [Bifidobacterium simiarum]
MHYHNPVIGGFYPDPSVTKANGVYYLACSSFRYFPAVPLFESDDLINWRQIGHALTRTSQIDLSYDFNRPGIFAPTLRYHDGRFYLVTTDVGGRWNFLVWTDDIHGEWSDPIPIDQGGIDPSLLFDEDHTYFMSNGVADDGRKGIALCEIDIETGEKLTPSRTIWTGTGGRFLEGPHLYRIGDRYYLLAAEGGTEYGHMITYARGTSPWGPFETYDGNPVLTNRDLGNSMLQGVGHGDLIDDDHGNWWMLHLGFRQQGTMAPYHHIGRETLLTPVTFDDAGWFTAGDPDHPGTASLDVDTDRIDDGVTQRPLDTMTFDNTEPGVDWCTLRKPLPDRIRFGRISGHGDENEPGVTVTMTGTSVTLDTPGAPTFLAMRQRDLCADIVCTVEVTDGEAGLTVFMDDEHHYDLAVQRLTDGYRLIKRVCVGDLKVIDQMVRLTDDAGHLNTDHLSGETDPYRVTLRIEAQPDAYRFSAETDDGARIDLGRNRTKYLSSEVTGGCFGVMIGPYAQTCGDRASAAVTAPARFTDFACRYR